MGVFAVSVGMGVALNPITDSVYCEQLDIGFSFPPLGADDLLTEDGSFILTEDLSFITTE